MNVTDEAFRRIAELPASGLRSEEDVKIKIVLPLLRTLGYDDADFNYEARTGRGYVDITVDKFPVGIVVETKSPRTRLDDYLEQLEFYLFRKHSHDRAATIAILTDGDIFRIYGVTDAFRANTLAKYQIDTFKRSEICNPDVKERITTLLDRVNNEKGMIPDIIIAYQQESREKKGRLQEIDKELIALSAERERIEAREAELKVERATLVGTAQPPKAPIVINTGNFSRVSSPHILRLLAERKANSRQTAVQRTWLDEKLVGKVSGIETHQEVSFGIIELKKIGKVDYDKPKSGSIRTVWLI